jgi:hypothetical protein
MRNLGAQRVRFKVAKSVDISSGPITQRRWSALVAEYGVDTPELQRRRARPRRALLSAYCRLVYVDDEQLKKLAVYRPVLPAAAEACGQRRIERRAAVLQVSDDGLMVRCHHQIPIHTPVAIDARVGDAAVSLAGVVRHCTQTVGAYKIGIELFFPDAGKSPPKNRG